MRLKKCMALVLSVLLIAGVILTVGCAGEGVKTPTQVIEDITAQEAFILMQNNQYNPDFVIIDVRTPEEFAEGHVEKAINIDYYSETFRDELNNLDKNKTYLVYCRSGNRSGNALNIMAELNFREVYNMSGGIIAWNAEGLPTTE